MKVLPTLGQYQITMKHDRQSNPEAGLDNPTRHPARAPRDASPAAPAAHGGTPSSSADQAAPADSGLQRGIDRLFATLKRARR
jgi:hypothetical protein